MHTRLPVADIWEAACDVLQRVNTSRSRGNALTVACPSVKEFDGREPSLQTAIGYIRQISVLPARSKSQNVEDAKINQT